MFYIISASIVHNTDVLWKICCVKYMYLHIQNKP